MKTGVIDSCIIKIFDANRISSFILQLLKEIENST